MTTAGSPTSKPRSPWPFGLLGMVAILVSVEGYIADRNIDLGTMYSIEWRLTGKAIRKQATKADILCFGTSLSRIGVSPLILEERTGHPTYNLALSGSQPYGSYLMLRHALDAGAKPKAIVVDFKWTAIANDPTGLERILPEVATFAECARMAWDLRDSDLLGRIALVAELPSYRCRVQIRKNVVAAVQGEEPVRNQQWLTAYRNMRVNKGAHHTPKIPFDGAINPADENFFPAEWKCNPVNELHIHKFLDLAKSRAIPIFLLVPPVSPAMQARLDETGGSQPLHKERISRGPAGFPTREGGPGPRCAGVEVSRRGVLRLDAPESRRDDRPLERPLRRLEGAARRPGPARALGGPGGVCRGRREREDRGLHEFLRPHHCVAEGEGRGASSRRRGEGPGSSLS